MMAKQGHKISFLKILNYTYPHPPLLINYDQSLNDDIFGSFSVRGNFFEWKWALREMH
jgi:hypothetical protein